MFDTIVWLIDWFTFSLLLVGVLSLLTYFGPLIVHAFVNKEQNLKAKYDAKWALVTGASSGIGKAISEKLAKQGINVVLVALDDDLLRNFHKELQQQYPKLQIRAVGVDLATPGAYMDRIVQATDDIHIDLLFNNAGFITIGFFADLPLERQMKNFEVNTVSVIRITHHFLNKMLAAGSKKGAIIFTSSPAGLFPSPFALMYGSTKAFLTEFAVSLASEVKGDGIDVLVIHPSPMSTNFYKADTAHKSAILQITKNFSYTPMVIADSIFANIGQFGAVVVDQGYFTVAVRALLKVLDANLFAYITHIFAPFTAEYKKLNQERQEKKKTQ